MQEGQPGIKQEAVPSFNLLLILKEEYDVDLFAFSMTDVCDRFRNGIVLHDKKENMETQFVWMDEKSGLNCFMLLPKSLRISEESGQVPCFVSEKESWCTGQEIRLHRVKYERVRRFNVVGKFGTMGRCVMGSKYEVVLFLKTTGGSERGRIYWSSTTTLSLPDGNQIKKPWEMWGKMPSEVWHPFQVGTFTMTPNNIGEMSFDLQVCFLGRPDILIKGVAIKPP